MDPTDADPSDDPFLWLEEVTGDRALAWVRERNAESTALLQAQPEYEPTRAALLALMNSATRIPSITRRGEQFYNLWQDAEHPRGLWRRTTLADYRRAEPVWETVLDLDALGAAEGENWVWGGAISLPPEHARCLLMLSRGGADATVLREFDTVAKAFVHGGFTLPEAKSRAEWIDADTIFVGSDFGPGTLTDSGYPRTVRRWSRGTPIETSTLVFEGRADDLSVGVSVDHTPGFERTLVVRALDFYHAEHHLLDARGLHLLDVPADAAITFWNSAGAPHDTLLLELRSPLQADGIEHPAGALLATDAAAHLAGERRFERLFTPSATRSLAGFTTTREHLIVNVLDDVASRLVEWHRTPQGFVQREIAAPFAGTLGAGALHDPMRADDPLAEHYLLSACDFLTPDTLSLAHTGRDDRETLKSLPARFDARGMRSEQCFATSADGTRVPYFIVWPAGTPTGPLPTLLYGYGGFEISLQPWYPAGYGIGWLARGGALAIANIRGGGEYGPAWHQAAIGAHKQRSYDDFIAVAEDLIARGVTRPAQLGIEGGSNGGLLVGAAFTQRPELFGAVICSVPLLDMKRYHRLLAGASWMAEFGDPDDPAQWAHIARYSPYHHLRSAQSGARYPQVLFTTSTRDDRVHPGHARKMAARMLALGHAVRYFENIEGGHGGAADNAQRAHVQALEMSHLWHALGGRSGEASPLPAEAQAVLIYWFAAPGTKEHGTQRKLWFMKDRAIDLEIAELFGTLIERALRGELAAWAATPAGALAEILLLDQFTRNVFRDTPRAFAGDRRALAAAQALIARGGDEALTPLQRIFVYLPFEHAESLAMQDVAVRHVGQLAALDASLQSTLEYAQRHRAVIARFGRFPHRNRILDRPSTDEELAYLREPGSGF